MKINIDGYEYALFEAVGGAALGDLRTLKRELGVTVKSIKDMFADMSKTLKKKGASVLDLLDDDAFIDNMIGLIFLARRKAGEDITIADAEKVSFQNVTLVMEDEDLNPKAD